MNTNKMTKATRAAQTTWLILVGLISHAAVWVALASQYADTRDMDGACLRNVPDEAVVIGDTPQVAADATFLPIGRACIYETTTGGTVSVQTGQAVTVAAVVGTVLCLVAVVLAWAPWKLLTPMRRLLPGIALFLLAMGWAAIWVQAAVR